MIRRALIGLGLCGAVLAAAVPAQEASAAELVYFRSDACGVCERWDQEVGGVYGKTDEAQRLPLRRQDIHADMPRDIAFIKGVAFTPTFVAVEDGREIGRIVGYVTDYFFWEQVAGLIKKADASGPRPVAACPGAAKDARSATC